MSGFQPSSQGPANVSTGTSPLLLGLLGALASLPAQAQQRKQEQATTAQTQAETAHLKAEDDPNNPENVMKRLQTQTLQQQIDSNSQGQALSQFQNLYKTAQTLPDWQSSPAIKTQLDKLSKDAGMPANPAYNADRGPVDIVGARLHSEF